MHTKTLVLVGTCTCLLFGCGDETTSSPGTNASPGGGTPNPSAAKASPGGFWGGTDSNGESIIMVVTEAGRFHLVDANLSQGSGALNVGDTNDVDASFQFVTEPGSTFADGTTSTFCGLSGSLVERQSMTVTVNCNNNAGLTLEFSATLSNKILYERDSSLAAIAGNYQGEKTVLDIAVDGTIFSQDGGTGCVLNGQVNIIDSAFNAYDVEFAYSNCTGEDTAMNGDSFVGIAVLDDTVAPEALYIAAIGDLDGDVPSFEGNFVSFVQNLDRL